MTRRIRLRLIVTAVCLAGAAPAAAQGGAADARIEAAPAAPLSYDAAGRRDPFVSLMARGAEPKGAASRPPGVAGLLIAEVSVKGIVRDRTGFIAMIQGPDRRTFIVRPGEQLLDGAVKAIAADGVVFAQEVTDPLSAVKQKEVRKAVRPAESGRG